MGAPRWATDVSDYRDPRLLRREGGVLTITVIAPLTHCDKVLSTRCFAIPRIVTGESEYR